MADKDIKITIVRWDCEKCGVPTFHNTKIPETYEERLCGDCLWSEVKCNTLVSISDKIQDDIIKGISNGN